MRRPSKSAALTAALTLVLTSLVVFLGASPAAASTCAGTAPSDFNGDGISDAAISEFFFDGGSPGVVHIIYGTPHGLTANASGTALDDQSLSNTVDGNSGFGKALAVGDFNGDGCSDLAIGDPPATVSDGEPVDAAGIIYLYYGSPTGLHGGQTIDAGQLTGGVIEDGGDFGEALAVGDFNHDGLSDIAVSEPGADSGGAVFVLPGNRTLIPTFGAKRFEQGDGTIPGANEQGDFMGTALAVGDFNGDGISDLAIGDPGENHQAGAAFVIRGSGSGAMLTATGRQTWTQNSTGIIGTSEAGDYFGGSLATGSFTGNGRTDLAIGAPFEAIGAKKAAGFVNVIYSAGTSGLTSAGNQGWSQGSTGIAGAVQSDEFGTSLAAGDYDGDGASDLAIGAPLQTVSSVKFAGTVTVIPGSSGGLTATGSTTWNQATTGIAGTPQLLDNFGASLAALRTTSPGRDDLLIGVPGDTVSGTSSAGSVEFLPGSTNGLTASGSKPWSTATAGIKGSPCGTCAFGGTVA